MRNVYGVCVCQAKFTLQPSVQLEELLRAQRGTTREEY